MKRVSFEPINETQDVHTGERLLDAILANRLEVLQACGGKGLCATCHVYIKQGAQQLSPPNERE